MKVSIVIPTLNEEKYIEKCLKSLRAQSVKAEIIVVDSKSKDKTVELALRYADKVITGRVGNIAYNRQMGSEISSGDIIVSTDADSFYPQGWLEKIVKYFEKDKNIVAVSGPTIPMPEESVFMDRFLYVLGNLSLLILHRLGVVWFRGSNAAYRRDAFFKSGGYDTTLLAREDSDLSKKVAKFGKTIFDWNIVVMTSMRRRRATGWLKTIRYYLDTPIYLITRRIYYERPEKK
ncbi:MAG: glycosyltransferase [Candidatus Altiarchaeales archaeon]|nr:glycosyltransferase [Candidatus Altiarchaeales archaeon]